MVPERRHLFHISPSVKFVGLHPYARMFWYFVSDQFVTLWSCLWHWLETCEIVTDVIVGENFYLSLSGFVFVSFIAILSHAILSS